MQFANATRKQEEEKTGREESSEGRTVLLEGGRELQEDVGGRRALLGVLTCCGAHTSHSGDPLSPGTGCSSDTDHMTPQGLW